MTPAADLPQMSSAAVAGAGICVASPSLFSVGPASGGSVAVLPPWGFLLFLAARFAGVRRRRVHGGHGSEHVHGVLVATLSVLRVVAEGRSRSRCRCRSWRRAPRSLPSSCFDLQPGLFVGAGGVYIMGVATSSSAVFRLLEVFRRPLGLRHDDVRTDCPAVGLAQGDGC